MVRSLADRTFQLRFRAAAYAIRFATSRPAMGEQYLAKYEWTNPVTGNPMKVEFQVWTI